jgi:signal transduction histidine kinase
VRVSEASAGGARGAEGGGKDVRELRVEVRNGAPDATAAAPGLPGGGHGLIGLRERAQLLGGTLEAHPLPDGGFVVRARLPGVRPVSRPAQS